MTENKLRSFIKEQLTAFIAEGNSDYKYTFGNYEIELQNNQVYFRKNGKAVKVIDVKPSFGKYEFKKMATKVAKSVGHSLTEDKADGYSDPAYRATIKQFKGKKVSKKEFAQALAMHHKSMDEGKLLENVDDAKFNLDKIFGDDDESIRVFQDIQDNGNWKDMLHYIEEWGNDSMLSRYGIRSSSDKTKLAKALVEGKLNEAKTFKPGDMWSDDFDYTGMMKFGSKVNISANAKNLRKLYNSLEDVNYHSENRLLWPAIEALESGDKKVAASLLKIFNKACLKTLKSFKEGITESRLTESREFVIIDPRGNARPVGSKIQAQQYLKKMGGARKGWHLVLKKNALKARRAIEKSGGRASSAKVQDIMFDLLYEGKSKSQKQLDILFKLSIGAHVKHGEDRLYKLSQAWESWNVDNDDQYDELVDPLYAAIELIQDAGEPGKNNVVKDKEYYSYIKSADKLLKKFNVAAKKAKILHNEGLGEARGSYTIAQTIKDVQNAKIGAKASGGGYSPFTKIKNNSWKNIKTGRLVHDKELIKRLGGFDDFIVEGKLTEIKKGDYIEDYGGVGLVNKVKGQVAYVKFNLGSTYLQPVPIADLKKKGKHKGKDLYVLFEGKLNEATDDEKRFFYTAIGSLSKDSFNAHNIKLIAKKYNIGPKTLKATLTSMNEGKLNEALSYDVTYDVMDWIGGYSSKGNSIASQSWFDMEDLSKYVKSDILQKKYHKKYDAMLKQKGYDKL